MSQPSPNPNMPRDTVETLKQIQKQGLSISIVSGSASTFSLPASASTESRAKVSTLAVDKAAKIPPRSQAAVEAKPNVLQSRLTSTPETRVSTVRVSPQTTIHDSKAPSTQSRVNQPVVSEAKGFSPPWSGSTTSTDNKVPGIATRAMVAMPVNKLTNSQARLGQLLVADSKTPVRINQSMLPENKNQARVALQGQRVSQSQPLIEGKVHCTQDRLNINPASPPDAKAFSNQVRTGQQFVLTHESKMSPGQRIIAPKPPDMKINQLNANKIDLKSTPVNRVLPNQKLVPNSRIRPKIVIKADAKPSPQMISDKVNSVRMVSNVLDNAVRLPLSKSSPAQMRLHPIVIGAEIPATLHSKMIQSGTILADAKLHMQGAKVAVSSSDGTLKAAAALEAFPDAPLRGPAGKRTAATLSPAKKKCVKRLPAKSVPTPENNNLNTSEDDNENGDKIFNSLKDWASVCYKLSASAYNKRRNLLIFRTQHLHDAPDEVVNVLSNRAGLTITPIRPATSTPTSTSNSNSLSRVTGETGDRDVFRIMCPSCNSVTNNPKFCHVCKCNLSTSVQGGQQSTEVVQNLPGTSYVVTKKMTNVIKQIIMPSDGMGQSQSIQTVQKQVLIKTSLSSTPRAKGRGRRKFVEPVCLTLSSDEEEEQMQAFVEENMSQAQMFSHDAEGTKSDQSSPTYQEEENDESDDQFPGVTDINSKPLEEKDSFEEEEEEAVKDMEDMEVEEEEEFDADEEEEELYKSEVDEPEEEDEVPPEEDDEEESMNKHILEASAGIDEPLLCRSVRIGSFKVHPAVNTSFMNIYLAMDGMSFNAPMVTDKNKIVTITLKPCDITKMMVHFGRCLPIVFVFTTPSFAEGLRKSLNMSSADAVYFDPNSNDEKQKKITFLVDAVNDDHRQFLRHDFLPENRVMELDQKTANEILVKSTPNQPGQYVRCELPPQQLPVSAESQLTVTPLQISQAQAGVTLKVTPILQPVRKLFTYPPPPQTGGIAITTEDAACLDEGEFLNDAIIDFYLKYIFYEKLSEYHREKTHIFSSYFFPRLTHKPERARQDEQKSLAMRRHTQVKTWTRHVDIFSKDFIIIPVNQNVHWFLAIICYPGLVPEAPEIISPDSKSNGKSIDNVTSTDDQEDGKITPKEPVSSVDGSNQNLDENSTASSNSAFESEEPDSEEPAPEAPDSSTHPDKNNRRKEAPCICIFDSLNGPNRSRIVTLLREYLEIEWKMKKGTRKVFDKTTMQGFIMQCPQQTNYSDCGIYLLQYVESFFENPIPYFDNPIPNLCNWFPKEKMLKKRQELKDLIISLQKKHASTINLRKTNTGENVPSPAQTLQTDNR